MRGPWWTGALTPPPVPRATDGAAYRMYRSILGAIACLLASLGAFTALPLVGRLVWGDPTVPERMVIALVLVAVAVAVLLRGERPVQLVALVVTFLLATPQLGTYPVANDSTVGLLLSAVGVMAARLMPMSRALLLAAVLGVVHTVTLRVLDLPASGLGVEAMVLVIGSAAAAIGFVNAMQTSAIATERIAVANRERELEITRAEAEVLARTMSRRVLHDDVLGTLHLVSDGVAPPERIRLQCRATADAIRGVLVAPEDHGGADTRVVDDAYADDEVPESWADMVSGLRAQAPVVVVVEVHGRPQRLPPLPDDQRAALLRAAAEGVRNAARHGRVDEVTLRLAADRAEVRVEVLDRGAGPGPAPRKGFGLKESVERPLAKVGGRSALLARPGGGAVLVLAVPRDQSSVLHHAYGLTTSGLGPVRTLARAVAVPLGAAWCVIAVRSVVLHPSTWPSLVVGLGWLAVTAAIVRRIERGSPGPRWVAIMAAATLLLQAAGIALLPPGAMLDFRSWTIGMSAVPLVVLVLALPLPVGLTVVVAHALAVVAAPEVRPELTDGLFPWGSLNGIVTCLVPSLVLGTLIRRQGRALRQQRRRELALEQRRAVEEWHAATTDLFFSHVRREVLPWLDEIARSDRRPDTPETVATARLLAAAARDDLYAPGFFDDALRADVARFRSGGGAVELRSGLAAGGHQRPVGRLLRGLLPVAAGRRIIVSPPVAPAGQVRISVVPAPLDGDIEALREGAGAAFEADVDPYRAVLLVDDLPGSG